MNAGYPGGNAARMRVTALAIVVPTLNEEDYITPCVTGLLEQMPRDARLYVADGGSTDRTVPIVAALARTDPRVVLVHNPRRTQAAAVNRVARMLPDTHDILVRVDAHSTYPPEFLSHLVSSYERERPASVVVASRTAGRTCFQKAVAAALNSRLGNGGAAHRSCASVSGPIDHGHHALFDLAFFRHIGGYDERFRANEDAELDMRITSARGRIWLCAEATRTYFPRKTPRALAKQFYHYGRGRWLSAQKHNIRPRLRQLLPVLATLANATALLLAPLYLPLALLPALYVSACLASGARLAFEARETCVLASGLAAIIMHMSFGAGFLVAWGQGRPIATPVRPAKPEPVSQNTTII
ncbi:MAG: glycosyltransferase family 2 protein [Hyphomicrobiales bacterium]|nr:MAG: glycosyltransferase family 2 protein [Hyphomicrobiales bacterium]